MQLLELSISSLDIEFTIRILLSVIFGAIIGFERELTKKPAGLRTHIFISMGACLFTLSSFFLIPEDTPGASLEATRIAAGVVTGTAFIGAGTIIASKQHIKGLTTASSIWVVGAIGLMVGLGNYLFPAVATIIAFLVLRFGVIADKMEKKKSD